MAEYTGPGIGRQYSTREERVKFSQWMIEQADKAVKEGRWEYYSIIADENDPGVIFHIIPVKAKKQTPTEVN